MNEIEVYIDVVEYPIELTVDSTELVIELTQETTSYTIEVDIDLKGDKGDTGATGPQGPAGADGTDGKTAYESAQDGGYTGNETQFNTDLADVSNKESLSNKKTDIEANKTSDTFYASIKSIYDWAFGKFQEALVSGTNIKTVNSTTVLGSGDLTVEYRPTSTTVTLSVAGWGGGTSQVATVTGATATNRLDFDLPLTSAQIDEIRNNGVAPIPSTQTTNQLTFYCDTTPTAEISMKCEIKPAL